MQLLEFLKTECRDIKKNYDFRSDLKQRSIQKKYQVYDNFMDNGRYKSMVYCPNCNTFNLTKQLYNVVSNPFGVPCLCNDPNYIAVYCEGTFFDDKVVIINKVFPDDECFIFSVVCPEYNASVNKGEDDDFEYLKTTKLTLSDNVCNILEIGTYIKGKGFYSYNASKDKLSTGPRITSTLLDHFWETDIIHEDSLKAIDIFALCANNDDIYKALSSDLNSKKQKTVKRISDQDIDVLYCASPIDFDQYRLKYEEHISIRTSSFKGIETYLVYCPESKTISTLNKAANDYNNTAICSHCQKKIHLKFNNVTSKHLLYYDKTDSGDVVIRIFYYQCFFNIDDQTVKHNFNEMYRIFLGSKKVRAYEIDDTTKKMSKIKYPYLSSSYLLQSEKEIADIIKTSNIKYSGFADLASMDNDFTNFSDISSKSYIISWYKHPELELLAKSGLYKICSDICVYDTVLPKASTPKKVLGINGTTFKLAKKFNLSLSSTRTLQSIVELNGGGLSEEVFLEMYNNNIMDKVLAVLNDSKTISLNILLNYLRRYKKKYDIDYLKALKAYTGYISACQKIGYDLSMSQICFPDNLFEITETMTNISLKIEQYSQEVSKYIEKFIPHGFYKNGEFSITLESDKSAFVKRGIELRLPPAKLSVLLSGVPLFVISDGSTPLYLFSTNGKSIKNIFGRYGKSTLPYDIKNLLSDWEKEVLSKIA